VSAMKNKLYDFLDKHSAFISVFGIASWLCFVFNLHANKPVAIAAAVFMIVFICVASFLILGATYRSHARALQSLMDKRNSSHPHTERLEIRTEDDFLDKIEKLAQASGITRSEVIHRAVGLYIQAYKEAEVGNVIQFVPENEATQFIPNQTSVR
jgi:predicted transcriptional regulator